MTVFSQRENCPSVTDVVFISGGRLFHTNGPVPKVSCSGPRHNQVTLTCRTQMATCRDCRSRTDNRHEVGLWGGELVKTLVDP